MNGCPPGLALIERLKATRKWAIEQTKRGNVHKQNKQTTMCDSKILIAFKA